MFLKYIACASFAFMALAGQLKFLDGERFLKVSVDDVDHGQHSCIRAFDMTYQAWPYEQYRSRNKTVCKIQILSEKGVVLDQAYCVLKEVRAALGSQGKSADISTPSPCSPGAPGDHYRSSVAFKYNKKARKARFLFEGRNVAESEISVPN